MCYNRQAYKMKITDEQIQEAKRYPIETLFGSNWKRAGRIIRVNCPFPEHRDSTPSFTIYPETNTWFCFGGCGGGDSIKFIEKYCNVLFQEAITYLNGKG